MQRYGDLMREIAEDEIRGWPVGQPFPLRPHSQAITLEIIMRTVFGIEDVDRLAHLRDRLGRMLDIGMHTTALASIVLVPIRRTIGRRIWERFQRLRDDTDAVLYDEIARRRDDPVTAERDDVLSILLQARDEQGRPMTDVELRDELMTLLVAGHETTATAIAWAFELLLRHPSELAKLQAELDAGESDDYLDAVIKETLRLRPVVPGVVRKLTEPLELNGYELPAGVRVAPNIYLTHRRPDVHPEPDRFRPERFLEQPAGTYTWIPFGGGVRRCLGASFALFEMKVVLEELVRSARLAPVRPVGERVRRRAITLTPEHGTEVIVQERAREREAVAA
jgi:cytochrome P450 family 135